MSFFDDIRQFCRNKLKSVETRVHTPDGRNLVERRDASGQRSVLLTGQSGVGFVPDLRPDLQVATILPGLSLGLTLSSDVVGALIMAGGGAIPGLFASVFGTFVTNNDLGLGTIMGSACFNTFVVVGVCSVFATAGSSLEWWPTTRDFAFFVVTTVALIAVINDTVIYWYESLMMLATFAVYVVILVYSKQLKELSVAGHLRLRATVGHCHRRFSSRGRPALVLYGGECVLSADKRKASLPMVASSYGGCASLKSSAVPAITVSSAVGDVNMVAVDVGDEKGEEQPEEEEDGDGQRGPTVESAGHGSIYPRWPWERPANHSVTRTAWWLINFPLFLLFALTVPDCRRPRLEKFFVVTFLLSIAYIGGITYLLTWLIDTIGGSFLVPDAILGVTVLAMGTGVPDLCCSVIVFRQGYSSMAIANGFGSNIIDILISLGLPWFVKTAFIASAGYINTENHSFTYTSYYVVGAILLLYVILVLNRFQLDWKMAMFSFLLYGGFLAVAIVLGVNSNVFEAVAC